MYFIYQINGFCLLLRYTCKIFLLVFQQCSLRNFLVFLKFLKEGPNIFIIVNHLLTLHNILFDTFAYIFFTPSIISHLRCSVL